MRFIGGDCIKKIHIAKFIDKIQLSNFDTKKVEKWLCIRITTQKPTSIGS